MKWLPAILLAATLTGGCGLFGSRGPTARDRSASLQIANRSNLEICSVQLARRGASRWGDDLLGPDLTIPPEGAHTLYASAGRYALRLGDCRGNTLYADRDLRLQGAEQVVFQPVGVQRDPTWGSRRFARRGANRMRM